MKKKILQFSEAIGSTTTYKPNFYYIVYDIFKNRNLLNEKNQIEDNYGGFQNLKKLLGGRGERERSILDMAEQKAMISYGSSNSSKMQHFLHNNLQRKFCNIIQQISIK